MLDVRGDNPSRSVDSRTWGLLDSNAVVGRPLFRVYPIGRISFVK